MFGKFPIIQAPMAGVSTVKLAAAVSNAGGVGSLGLAGKSPQEVREQISSLKEAAAGPFNINFFCFNPQPSTLATNEAWLDYLQPLFESAQVERPPQLQPVYKPFDSEILQVVLELRPPIVSFHFGAPDAYSISALRAAGIALFGSATSLQEARHMQSVGMDAVVAQGDEAGGHRGTFDPAPAGDEHLGMLELVRLLAGHLEVPVIAAGGIMNGAQARQALEAGAAAVQMGTAFIGCPESAASEAYRRNLKQCTSFLHNVVSGRPARGLPNAFVEFAMQAPTPVPSFPEAYSAQKALAKDARFVNEWAGENCALAQEIPAAELVCEIAASL